MSKKYNKIESKVNPIDKEDEDVLEKKELTKIISAQPRPRKKGLVGRLITGIAGPEGASGIGEYVNEEIIKPAIKNIIVDAVISGITMVVYGEKGGPVRHSYNRGDRRPAPHSPNRTSYSSQYREHSEERKPQRSVRYGVREYEIDDRLDASHVLSTLTEHADIYNVVSVADYYDLIGVEHDFTDNNYGWTYDNIIRATVVSVRGGWIIKFPPVEVIS